MMIAQDPPEEFEFNQSVNQGFYFFLNLTIDNEDLQSDDWIGVFNSYDEIILSLKVMNELWSKIKFNKINMKNAVDQSNSTATDLANWFVKELNLTFREAYQLTGKIVAYSNNNGKLLKDLSLNELKVFNKNISAAAKKILSSAESIKNKTSFGGTSPQNTKKTIQYAIRKYL